MRKLHASQGQWEVAVQIGEVEAALPMRPDERAALLAEMGTIWLEQLGDRNQAIAMFKRALDEDPTQIDALEGSARAYAAAGQIARAADAWDRVIELLRGPARAIALVARARLAEESLRDVALAADLYRRALTDDPDNLAALEAVAGQAVTDENWTLLVDLQERRFELTPELRSARPISRWRRVKSNGSACPIRAPHSCGSIGRRRSTPTTASASRPSQTSRETMAMTRPSSNTSNGSRT